MTNFDPFLDETVEDTGAVPFADEPEAPVKKAAPKKAVAKPASDREGVTVTLKGGAGFDAPWIVIHAADIADAYEQVSGDNASLLAKLMEKASAAAAHFSGQSKPSSGARSAPQGAAEPPAGTAAAPGPDWTYKTGVGKTGKTWKGWFPPRGSSESPVWL